jgi:hypothetical protein
MPRIDEIRMILNESNAPDIFVLCKTFLCDSVEDKDLKIDNYTFERRDRVLKGSGGIVIYIKDTVS